MVDSDSTNKLRVFNHLDFGSRRLHYFSTVHERRATGSGERGPLAAERARVHLRQPLATTGAPDADRHVVADQPSSSASSRRVSG